MDDSHADYRELRARIDSRHLLDKQLGYQLIMILSHLLMLSASIAIVIIFKDVFWLQILNAVFMGFIFTQIAFIGHDSGHLQLSKKIRHNSLIGHLAGFIIGINWSYWVKKHNEHHAHPNEAGHDPDIEIPFIAFSEEQAMQKKGIFRWIVRNQALYFFFLIPFQAFSLRYSSIEWVFSQKKIREYFIIPLHLLIYLGFLFYFLPIWTAVAFIVIHQLFFGTYLASVFAPNHKGMLIPEKGHALDFVRLQVLTARNVRPSWLTDYWYGGLNYQIEHHLFPSMPRSRLKKAQAIIKEFCKEKGISYYETSMIRSYIEIISHLHEVSRPLRS